MAIRKFARECHKHYVAIRKFDRGYELNGFAWVTCCWEISMVEEIGHLDVLTAWPQELTRNWSLMGEINQKQTRPQDQPVALRDLPEEWRTIILNRYPALRAKP